MLQAVRVPQLGPGFPLPPSSLFSVSLSLRAFLSLLSPSLGELGAALPARALHPQKKHIPSWATQRLLSRRCPREGGQEHPPFRSLSWVSGKGGPPPIATAPLHPPRLQGGTGDPLDSGGAGGEGLQELAERKGTRPGRRGGPVPARPGAGGACRHRPAPSAPRSGRGRSSTQARGQAGTCWSGSGRAGPGRTRPQSGGVGPGQEAEGPPRLEGGGRGWSGLAVRGPGAPWVLAEPRSGLLAPRPESALATPLPVPLYGCRGPLGGRSAPRPAPRLCARLHGDPARRGPSVRPSDPSPRAARQPGPARRAEPLRGDAGSPGRAGPGRTGRGAVSARRGAGLGRAGRGAQRPVRVVSRSAGPRAGRSVPKEPSDGGWAGRFPRAVATLPAGRPVSSPSLRRAPVGLGRRTPTGGGLVGPTVQLRVPGQWRGFWGLETMS